MKKSINIGLIICDPDEYKQLKNLKYSSVESFNENGFFGDVYLFEKNDVIISLKTVCSGLGKVNAASCAMYLICNGVDIILNTGYSGGFINGGNLVIGEKFIEHDFDLTPLGYKPSEKPGQDYIWYSDKTILESFSKLYDKAVVGTFVTGDSFICSDVKANQLKNDFGAIACDMESAAIASVCSRASVKFMSIRLISDGGNDSSVDTYLISVNDGLKASALPSLIFNWIESTYFVA